MKIKAIKQPDGNWTLIVKRTRPRERPSQCATGVTPREYAQKMQELIELVMPEARQESAF